MSDELNTVEQHASYGIGRQMGEQLLTNSFDGVDVNAVISGITDAMDNRPHQVEPNLINDAFKEIQQRLQAGAAEKAADGEAFLAENAKRDGITVTESGLQYEVITVGEGEKPSATSTVRTHYHGTLIDGSVFDSSYDRGEPAEFPVNGVIAGWTEALQMMGVGSKWRLYLPHQLAYGERGAGGAIAPYSALVFDVELLDIL